MAKVLKPLVGKSPHYIQSTSDFISKVRKVTLLPGECLSSYNVTALFSYVPIDPAINIIKNLLEEEENLCNKTVLSVQNIIELLGIYLHNTYFSFQNEFYEQVEGGAMGSPVQQQAHKQLFLDQINNINPAINFTVKGNQENGAIPFLDTLVKPEADNSLSIKVYHKLTNTDQYLQGDSHHNLSAKYSVIGTLIHRAKTSAAHWSF